MVFAIVIQTVMKYDVIHDMQLCTDAEAFIRSQGYPIIQFLYECKGDKIADLIRQNDTGFDENAPPPPPPPPKVDSTIVIGDSFVNEMNEGTW
jgi:hypothetical protein